MRTKKVTVHDGRLEFHRVNTHGFIDELPFKDWVLDILTDITGDCRFDALVDKRFPFRFRVANFIMRDELRSALGGVYYYIHEILDHIPEEEDDPETYWSRLGTIEWYAKRALRDVNTIW